MSNSARVLDFFAAWNAKDLDGIMSFFAEDAVYQNVPVDPYEGPEAIREVLTGFVAMASEIDWQTHYIAEDQDGVVLTERTDRFLINDKWLVISVMGTFELEAGLIKRWRDYFDWKDFETQMAIITA